MDHEFKTSGVMLREIAYKDWHDVHKYASNEIVCKYQPWGPNSEQESVEYVEMVLNDAQQIPRTRYVFAIIVEGTGMMIGAGEITIRDIANHEGEIGYIINPEYWNKGFATKSGKLLMDYGFYELKLHRIYATCDPRNVSSEKVLRKLGMEKEGRLREDVLLRDGWRDSLIYSMLQDEWTEGKML